MHLEPEIAAGDASEQFTCHPTLAAGVSEQMENIIQVTPHCVNVWSNISAERPAAVWETAQGEDFIAAQVHDGIVLVAKRGGELILLKIRDTSIEQLV